MGEFDLIERYFKRPTHKAALGVGDDCALLKPTEGMQLAVSSDMLVEGRHFISTVDPARLGHKALAVNLSDLAAVGAEPLAFTLALSLPRVDEAWLAGFSSGILRLADEHGCELVGGDTTQGPLNICITVFGEVPPGDALLRQNAQVGDDIYISGTVGDARLALEVFRGTHSVSAEAFAQARLRMEQPTPRVTLGTALRAVANAAIDVSDGLLGDLGHILKRSGVGAQIDTGWLQTAGSFGDARLPAGITSTLAEVPWNKRLELALSGGDDYELCFTAPVNQRELVHAAAWETNTPVTRIGRITQTQGLEVLDPQGQPIAKRFASFDHFA
ncbi:thiamine-phosphate kinase [Limnohabitans sp.]|uniref:thiamine-phosphate kinase n=1 Tax=Limnohabitans sp. TaxID=1907725 RepID=UPI003340F44B